ncbi:MAG: cytidine deaminase [Kiritimatiellae bacterium]|nr:cytidine deaminase [Kiritimatiellia bacterium]
MNSSGKGRDLMAAARQAVAAAHAPYSGYRVGAAVQDERGRVFVGVNVENASYGLTLCAERVAVGSAVAAGARRIVAVAVTASGRATPWPCGACRQVLTEFADESTPVWVAAAAGRVRRTTVGALLPYAFRFRERR